MVEFSTFHRRAGRPSDTGLARVVSPDAPPRSYEKPVLRSAGVADFKTRMTESGFGQDLEQMLKQMLANSGVANPTPEQWAVFNQYSRL